MACCHCMHLLRAVLKGRGKVTNSSSNAQPHRCKGSAQLSMCRCPGPPGLSLGINPTAKSQELPQCLCPSMVPGCVATDPSCDFQTRMCWSPPRHFLVSCVISMIKMKQPLKDYISCKHMPAKQCTAESGFAGARARVCRD